jgi:hypothetical protein
MQSAQIKILHSKKKNLALKHYFTQKCHFRFFKDKFVNQIASNALRNAVLGTFENILNTVKIENYFYTALLNAT